MKCVLIIDDDPGIVDSLSLALSDQFEILTAGDGEQALSLLAINAVDAVLLDLMMPVLDGVGFLKEIERRQLKVNVIVMSANPHVTSLARTHGAFDALTKPFTLDDLDTKLARAVDGGDGGSGRSGGLAERQALR